MGLFWGMVAGALFALFHGLRAWKLALGFGSAGLILFALASHLVPDRFTSKALLAARGGERISRAVEAVRANTKSIADQAKLPERFVRDGLRMEVLANGQVVSVEFSDTDRETARRVVRYTVSEMVKSDWGLEIFDHPTSPELPYGPNRAVVAGFGLVAGLGLAAGIGMRRRTQR